MAVAAASAVAALQGDGEQMNRVLANLITTGGALRRAFPDDTLQEITAETGRAERSHSGEIRVAIESSLDIWQLYRGVRSRERAIDVFSSLRVWDTAENTGVLIYILLAEHALEIVADRGIAARVPAATWDALCKDLQAKFSADNYREGIIDAIQRIAALLAEHLEGEDGSGNELTDRPTLLR